MFPTKKSPTNLEEILQDQISHYEKEIIIKPGIYGAWDPAKINDASAFIIAEKPIPTDDNPDPKLLIRGMKDLSLDDEGKKCVGYIQQMNKIINYDTRFKFNKIVMDETGNQSSLSEYLRLHFFSRIQGETFSIPKKKEWISSAKIVLQDQLIEFNPHHDNFPLLRKEMYELDPVTLRHTKTGTDDFIWALMMLIQASGAGTYQSEVTSGFSNAAMFCF